MWTHIILLCRGLLWHVLTSHGLFVISPTQVTYYGWICAGSVLFRSVATCLWSVCTSATQYVHTWPYSWILVNKNTQRLGLCLGCMHYAVNDYKNFGHRCCYHAPLSAQLLVYYRLDRKPGLFRIFSLV